MHFTHHAFTSVPDKDLELMGAAKFEAQDALARFIWSFSAILSCWRRLSTLFRHFFGNVLDEHYMSQRDRALIICGARLHIGLYSLAAMFSLSNTWMVMYYWLLPLLLTKPPHHIQNIVEHSGMPLDNDVTRNIRAIRVNPVLRRRCWNMQYHWTRHFFRRCRFTTCRLWTASFPESNGTCLLGISPPPRT